MRGQTTKHAGRFYVAKISAILLKSGEKERTSHGITKKYVQTLKYREL